MRQAHPASRVRVCIMGCVAYWPGLARVENTGVVEDATPAERAVLAPSLAVFHAKLAALEAARMTVAADAAARLFDECEQAERDAPAAA
jgi:predicted naringenin-chalcone synthase